MLIYVFIIHDSSAACKKLYCFTPKDVKLFITFLNNIYFPTFLTFIDTFLKRFFYIYTGLGVTKDTECA